MQHILPIFCSKFATKLGQIWTKSFNTATPRFPLNLILNLKQISLRFYLSWVLKSLFMSNLKYPSIKNRSNFSNHLQKASQ